MAISSLVAVPSIFSAYSVLTSRSNKAHPRVVALNRSEKNSSLIVSNQPEASNLKASRIAVDIVRTISEKDEGEIQAELNRLQNSWEMLKGFFKEIILVLIATNPILTRLSDAMLFNDDFLRWSSAGASYGAMIVLKEFVKVLCKAQPTWGFTIMGFLIYKASMYNIALHREGRNPVWLGPLTVVVTGKFLADCFMLLARAKWTPLNIILASIEITLSSMIAANFHYHLDFPPKVIKDNKLRKVKLNKFSVESSV